MNGTTQNGEIRVGISSCLLGEMVRHDGGHKRDRFITGTLAEYFTWVSVCPEEEVGMGVPREAIRLVGDPGDPRLLGRDSGEDWTRRMKEFAERRCDRLEKLELHGYILKKSSPSCGMERVKVYSEEGHPLGVGRGLFAEVLISRFPLLPVEEEGRLHDPRLRENFIDRIFAYHRWKTFRDSDPGPGDLVEFHTRHKLTLQSHAPETYREMGRMVARAGSSGSDVPELLESYGRSLMEALGELATTKKHTNVLQHLLGYLRDRLGGEDRQELVELIEQYRREQVPLVVPLTLFRHHFRRHPVDWVMKQTYLNPYPQELMLRNHV